MFWACANILIFIVATLSLARQRRNIRAMIEHEGTIYIEIIGEEIVPVDVTSDRAQSMRESAPWN